MAIPVSQLRVAMLADNEAVMDKRIHREAKALSDAGFDLTLYAVQHDDLPNSEVNDGIKIERIYTHKILDVKAPRYLHVVANKIAIAQPHVVHCHDWVMLHVGVLVKKLLPGVVLVYDSHELFHSWPIHYSSRRADIVIKTWLVRQFEIMREKRDGKYIDHLVTVSQSLADHLEKYFDLRNAPTLVRNFAELEPITSHEEFVRNAFNIRKSTTVVVLFALFIYRKRRNLETVIEQFANQPNTALVIFCKTGGHKQHFVELVKQRGITNVYFHDAIAPQQIVNYLASCDVGLIPTWNKKHLSYWLGLENKLFHYVMSGLPVLASAQPEHMRIVEGYDIGVCVNGDEPNGYVTGLQKVMSRYEHYKRNVEQARLVLNWNHERESLIELYRRIAAAVA